MTGLCRTAADHAGAAVVPAATAAGDALVGGRGRAPDAAREDLAVVVETTAADDAVPSEVAAAQASTVAGGAAVPGADGRARGAGDPDGRPGRAGCPRRAGGPVAGGRGHEAARRPRRCRRGWVRGVGPGMPHAAVDAAVGTPRGRTR